MLNGQCVLRNWRDFGFDEVELPYYSTAGTLYSRRMPYGMPKIPPEVLHSPFYLYHSLDDAKAGRGLGGTGFFIGYPTGISDRHHVYAVTNWHVVVDDGASVIRVNKVQGGFDCFDLGPEDWEFKPGWHDVAVTHFPHLRDRVHRVVCLKTELFLDPKTISGYEIGPGDDVFMLGRFVDHDGIADNVPSARFGNISMMPQPIEQPTGAKNLPSFVLDVHSRTGYSGSPVFVYRTYGSDLTTDTIDMTKESTHFIKLLGIHWGQFPEMWEIASGASTIVSGVKVSGDEQYIKGMSGMTLAVPAWAIMELLDMPKFKKQRAEWLEKAARAQPNAPTAESAQSTMADNPSHKEDFMALVDAAAQKRPRDG